MEKRIFKYDLMRVIFMLMVLATHTLNIFIVFSIPYNTTWTVRRILVDIFMVCNPLFFMLSGKFNLDKEFKDTNDYKKFYLKKAISILIPFLLISIAVYILNFYNSFSIKSFFSMLISNQIESTFWFVYVLIGILIFSPFFSKMMKNLNLFEKKLFLLLLILANCFTTVLALLKIKSAFTLVVFGIASWHMYYFAGYIIEDIFKTRKSRVILIIGAVIAYILQFLIRYFIDDSGYRITDPFPLLTIETFGIYFFILEFINIKNLKIQKIISYISKYSYVFYLLHMLILNYVFKLFDLNISSLHNAIVAIPIFSIAFLVTLILSIIFSKFIFNPLQKKLITISENKIIKN